MIHVCICIYIYIYIDAAQTWRSCVIARLPPLCLPLRLRIAHMKNLPGIHSAVLITLPSNTKSSISFPLHPCTLQMSIMHIHVCVYIYIYTYMYFYFILSLYIHIYIYIYMYTDICIYIYIYMCTAICVSISLSLYVYIYIYIYIYTYTYACVCIYIYIYIYVCTCILVIIMILIATQTRSHCISRGVEGASRHPRHTKLSISILIFHISNIYIYIHTMYFVFRLLLNSIPYFDYHILSPK